MAACRHALSGIGSTMCSRCAGVRVVLVPAPYIPLPAEVRVVSQYTTQNQDVAMQRTFAYPVGPQVSSGNSGNTALQRKLREAQLAVVSAAPLRSTKRCSEAS